MPDVDLLEDESRMVTAVLTETGTELTFEVNPGQTIAALVALHTAISVHDQIILSANGEPVSENQSGVDDSMPIYIFSRRILNASKMASRQKKVSVKFDFDPLYRYALGQHDDANFSSSELSLFRGYLHSITEALQAVYANSQRQIQGLQIALVDLNKRFNVYDESVQEFSAAFSEFSEQADNFTLMFEEYIRQLSLVEIHEAVSRHQETLLDKFSEGRLRSMLNQLHKNHKLVTDFKTQIYQQRKTIIDACRGEADLLDEPPTSSTLFCFPFTPLYHLKETCDAFRKFVSEVDDLHPRVTTISFGSVRNRLSDLLNVEEFQVEMVDFIRNRLSSISDVQTRIRQETKRLLAYEEVLSQKRSEVSALMVIKDVPEAYLASLIEIVRRQSFVNKILDIVKTAECLREAEIEMRSTYLEQFGCILPKDLIMGLDRQPPQYFSSLESIDEGLPRIDSLTDVKFPSAFHVTDKLKRMIEKCCVDEATFCKMPLIVRNELSSSEDRGKSLLTSIDQTKGRTSDISAVLAEKDRRILELENEKTSLTIATAVMYQENKTLNDMMSRPHIIMRDFKEGDLVAVRSGSNELLNLDCSGYFIAESCQTKSVQQPQRLRIGVVKTIELSRNQAEHIVDIEFFGEL